jgi:predicted transcriptional regulator
MSLSKFRLQVLAILADNLKHTSPQLVSSTIIAEQMNMGLSELQKVLKSLEGIGGIETDLDLRYNLITQKGLQLLVE